MKLIHPSQVWKFFLPGFLLWAVFALADAPALPPAPEVLGIDTNVPSCTIESLENDGCDTPAPINAPGEPAASRELDQTDTPLLAPPSDPFPSIREAGTPIAGE